MYILLWLPHIAPLYSKLIWFQFYHSITFSQPFPFTKWCGTPCSWSHYTPISQLTPEIFQNQHCLTKGFDKKKLLIPDSQSHMPSGDSLVSEPAKPAVCQSAKATSESFNFIKFPNASKKIGCKMLMVQTQWHGISLPPRPLYEPKTGRNMKKPMAPPTTWFPTGAVAGWTSSVACPGLQRQQCFYNDKYLNSVSTSPAPLYRTLSICIPF